ncbi:hypothetical protein V8G56_03815 [Gaetbulibacter aquiaggeris]|uniref:Receptor L-domain domain-containing protein n=1 Tax=Gaetbulibacter aquiaggeris TaxID=1735373 RepID=A0ABW7MM04_9FLAO
MRIRIFTCFLLAGILLLNSCVQGDIDELQNQINDLNSKLEDLQRTQQEALLAAIASLQADLALLNSELVGDLELLQQEVENNANAVYYGNVITDGDYALLTAQGATIITGRVVISSDAHVQALADVKLIGKNLEIMGGSTITMTALQSVGENLLVSNISEDATIDLSTLSSVGGDFEVMNNSGLTSLMANNLVLISGGLNSERNLGFTTLSFAKLDQVDDIYVNEYDDRDFDSLAGDLATLELSSANVNNDVSIHYLGAVANLALGSIGGDFICEYSDLAKITSNAATIGGDFIMEYNKFLSSIDVVSLSRIEGKLRMVSNYDWNTPGSGLTTMPSFAALTFIGGDVYISSNSNLTTVEAFNNVTEVRGTSIEFSGNGNLDNVNIFNALVDTANPASQWGDYSHASINVNANTFWFTGFNALTEALNLNVSIAKTAGVFNEVTGEFEPGGDTSKFEGFDNLTDVSVLELTVSEVTEFNAFGALNNFKNYQTYLTVYMPNDPNVGLCSMEPIFTKIKSGAFDNWNGTRKAVFTLNWSEQDRDTAIDQLLAPCTP